ncbi:peptide ABC transporter substrate-binding protein [Lactobacillus sp. W8089]|nr:peptide ABC transporter substrate-binding protein [Lactobacillus sp. W8086]MBI0109379.1 peptide ABC transporter substrate-binding protein [Lactobacillus sp. W8085]MBI0112706.1 peptide ABC transporter substrate-binding protein [Lactobacillus sp. W8088]MBI0116422.1 peptide ABC transporter substrate-binding protein [Lactobacillus sp. W8087]MBI0120036.1 peptide ABC transporter substrate-binding protein [Lactobacillus sp. W8089]MBI0132001.1 peptide ABC transporter substrate-binding protein [Lact
MKLKKLFVANVLALFSTVILVGCGSTSSQKSAPKGTVRISSKDIISTMDPSLNTDVIGAQNLNNTMEGLYRFKGKDIKPALATNLAKPTNNGLTYTFKLRPNAKWSNGDPITASDFVYSWRRTVDPKTKSTYSYIFEGIANAKDISAGKKPVNSLGIKALNKHTLQVDLEKPVPYFNTLLTSPTFFPQNKKVITKWGKKYGTNSQALVSNGPFKLVKWNSPDNSWTEVKNDKYWDAKDVKVQKLQYQVVKDASTALNLYQANKLDRVLLTGDSAKQMKNAKDYKIQKESTTFYVAPNIKKVALFNNTKIRQALSMSVNRQQLTKKVLGDGKVASLSTFPAKMTFNPETKVDFAKETQASAVATNSYNPTKAKQLWQEGLSETNNKGKKFTFTLLGDDSDVAKKQAEFLQNQFEKLPGLKINVTNVPFKSRLARAKSGDFDLLVTGWSADFPDPITFLTLFNTDASNNDGKWSNTEYDNLVNKSLNEDANNPMARWQDMKAAQNLSNREVPAIPLYQNGEAWLTKSRVKNLDYGPTGAYNMISLRLKD